MDLCLIQRTVYQTVSMMRKVVIAHTVEHIQTAWRHLILYLGGLRILLLYGLIVHLTMEIAVIAEYVLSHRGTQLWINPRHEHRLTAKGLGHPVGKGGILLCIFVPYADTKREGQTVVATSKQRTVGCRSQSGLHLRLRLNEVIRLLGIHPLNILQASKQLVSLRDILCHRTGSQEQHSNSQQPIAGFISCHCA